MPEQALSRRHFFRDLAAKGLPAFNSSVRDDDSNFSQGDHSAFRTPHSTFGKAVVGDLTPYNGPWTPELANHLLRRLTFGANKAQLDQIFAFGSADAAVDFMLTPPPSLPSPPLNNYNGPDFTDPNVPSGQTWVNTPLDFTGEAEGYRIESWRGWWLRQMILEPANIREKMTLFWHNHFALQASTVFVGRALYQHNQMLRADALGNFKTLVKDVTLDAAMLFYLNGYLNDKDAPDENYARELQELFTVGKDSPDQYTEDDVVAAARVLTGWRINFVDLTSFFDPTAHDTGDKQFSAFYNYTIVQGSTSGNNELDALLNMLFDKNQTAEYICRKLYRFFVYYVIDDAVETDVIQPLAQIMRDNNHEILPVLSTLFKSEHFFEAYNLGGYIKSPIDQVVGVMRNFNLDVPASTLYDEWLMLLYLNYLGNAMQMMPGEPPNVAGWPAWRQSPNYYRNWITADTIRNRNVYSDILSLYALQTDNDELAIDHIAFASQFDNPGDPNLLLDDMLRLMLPQPMSAIKKGLLKGILLSGQANDVYWTSAWITYQNNPTDQMAMETVRFRLSILHKYIMSLPEYQLI